MGVERKALLLTCGGIMSKVAKESSGTGQQMEGKKRRELILMMVLDQEHSVTLYKHQHWKSGMKIIIERSVDMRREIKSLVVARRQD